MPFITVTNHNVPIKIWAPMDEVEPQALDQLRNVAALPWVFHHVAAMADVHLGHGATVGSVIAMKDAVAPAAVGVDIGCGMLASRTSLRASDLPSNLGPLRAEIEKLVPVGFAMHDGAAAPPNHQLRSLLNSEILTLLFEFGALDESVADLKDKAARQLGTLGGGNHFIEVCLDRDHQVWIVLHSGSRNIGKTLAEVHMARAQQLAHNQDLPDRELAVFLTGTSEMAAYRRDLYWAQRYALVNRQVMLALIEQAMATIIAHTEIELEPPIMCHHNYVAEETHFGEQLFVTRKGAIRAGSGELGIIPGSMGARSFIVKGLGNPESFLSASHGAGRRMSRGAARRKFSRADLIAQTAGVECRKDDAVIDEIPAAYKDIDTVMRNQVDLVEVVTELKQVLCVKG